MDNSKRPNIAILFGGCSSEYGVSLNSAATVIRNIDRERYNPVPIGISRKGDWFYYTGNADDIQNDTWQDEQFCTPALVSPNRSLHQLFILKNSTIKTIRLDAALPVLHGRNGEDGTVQGAFELAGIPVAGCDTLASALCMDKDRAHKMASLANVRVPKSSVFNSNYNVSELYDFAAEIGFPIYVKPVKAGSSYGISKVTDKDALLDAVSNAFEYDNEVILEENIDGFEVGCAVLGTTELITGEIDEIELSDGFFDFTEKYTLKTSSIYVPARISLEKSKEIKDTAKRIYKILGCKGFARVDMFLTSDGGIVFNEVNTIPGFTAHSRYPNMMKAAGLSFTEVITKIIEQAVTL